MPARAEMMRMDGNFTYEEATEAICGSALELDVSFACVDGKIITHIEQVSPEKPKKLPKHGIRSIEWV